jgi:hypothetical protein
MKKLITLFLLVSAPFAYSMQQPKRVTSTQSRTTTRTREERSANRRAGQGQTRRVQTTTGIFRFLQCFAF